MQCDVRRNCGSRVVPMVRPKSLWQLVVLLLRILAGQPTTNPRSVMSYNADGLSEMNLGDAGVQLSGRRRFSNAVPSQYWCLVDCKRNVEDVPNFLGNTMCFPCTISITLWRLA